MKKRIYIPLLILFLIIFTLWLAVPYWIKNFVDNVIADIEGYKGSVASVEFNPLQGGYTLNDVIIDKIGGDDRFAFITIEQVQVSPEWGALLKGNIFGKTKLLSPGVHLMAETDRTEAQFGDDVNWRVHLQKLMIVQVNQVLVEDGYIHFLDLGTDPVVDLHLSNLEVSVLNIQNLENLEAELPSAIEAQAVSIGGGDLKLKGSANPLKPIPDVELTLQFEKAKLNDFTDFFKSYTGFNTVEGDFSLYSELVIRDSQIEGYLQPMLFNLSVLDLKDEDHNVISAALELIIEGVIQIVKQHPRDQIATRIPLRGEVKDPEADLFSSVWNIFNNAFIEAFEQKVDGTIEFE